jgi:Zn finger protein HypA/HybF involved in hydrogenase expression
MYEEHMYEEHMYEEHMYEEHMYEEHMYEEHMYEEHTIKCSSCGKLFTSKENETVCNECYKELENIKL